jgi:hypothetical protein
VQTLPWDDKSKSVGKIETSLSRASEQHFIITLFFKKMRQTTLLYIFRNNQTEILLAMKKRGFGTGKYNGTQRATQLTQY